MWPIAFQLGSFEVGSYGLLLVTAIGSAFWLAAHLGARDGLPTKKVNDLDVIVLILGVVGAKTLDTIVTSVSSGRLIITDFRSAGAVHGGLIVGTLALVLLSRRFGLSLGSVLESHAPAVALGQAFGRIGCFLSGCCFGRETDSVLGVVYESPLAARISGVPLHIALHPVQLYDAGAHFLLALLLAWFHKRRLFEGRIFYLWCCLEGLVRISVETFRGDEGRGLWGLGVGISTGRLTALGFLIVGIVGLIIVSGRASRREREERA